MNDIDKMIFLMLINTQRKMLKFKYVWVLNPAILAGHDLLTVNIRQIRDMLKEKLNGPKSLTLAKDELRDVIEPEAFAIKQALVAYFNFKGDVNQVKLLSYPKSHLAIITDNDLFMAASYIYKKAEEFKTFLGPYGTTPAQIDQLKANNDEFERILPELKLALIAHSKVIAQLALKIKDCRVMLKKIMDPAVGAYEESNPDFFKSYKLSRRRVKKPGVKGTYMYTIKGTVKDSVTKQTLANIRLEVGAKKKVVVTDAKGNFETKVYKKDATVVSVLPISIYQPKTVNIPKTAVKNCIQMNIELSKISKLGLKLKNEGK